MMLKAEFPNNFLNLDRNFEQTESLFRQASSDLLQLDIVSLQEDDD